MGFKLGSVLKASLPFGLGSMAGGSNALSKSVTQDQVPLETPEQRKARQMLLEFAKTGVFGNFTAGQDLGLGLGDFGITGTEEEGLTQLQELLQSSLPEQFAKGNAALDSMLNPDPSFVASQFDPFKVQVERQIADAVQGTKRNSAYTGNLYSTAALKNLGDVEAKGQETLASQLANLTNESLNRRLQAIPLAYQAGTAAENIKQNRIGSAFQYGDLTRRLNDAQIKSRDAEILRRRQELLLPLQSTQSLAGQNANFGVPSVTTSQPTELMQLLQLLVQGGSMFAGARGGG